MPSNRTSLDVHAGQPSAETSPIELRVAVRDLIGRPFHKATVGYWVAEPYTGRGHATAALGATIERLRRRGDLHRIEASAQVANEASHRVLRKNGFTLMGVARQHIVTAGDWHDELLWESLLDADPTASEGEIR